MPRLVRTLVRTSWLVVAAGALFPAVARAVDVTETIWGFDGQIVMQRFNLMSLKVDNPSANTFEGTIELRKVVAGKQVDAKVVEPLYLSPFSSRWVQFYPYVKSDWDAWEVSWGTKPAERFTPPTVRAGKAAAVLLDDPDAIPQSAGAIKRLPANLFPPHSTATDCLAAVVLDHAPRWDPARQKSFLEWLKRGGRVYLIRTLEDKVPEFTGELQVLNGAGAKQRVGAGYVYRVERNRRLLDAAYVERVIAAGIEPGTESAADLAIPDPAKPAAGAAGSADASNLYGFVNFKWDPEAVLLTNLKKMSMPEHSWILIHVLSLIYLGLVYPGCYAIGRKYQGDYRATFGFLLGAIGLFSLAFLFVGRRGHNETTVMHSVAIARQEAPGVFDVTQWSNAFAVEGGKYSFEHQGSGRIYSTCQDTEIVHGEIRNGPEAHLLADMPPYSSRAFSHRALLPAPPIEVEVEDWSTRQDETPQALTARSAAGAGAFKTSRALVQLTLRKVSPFPAEIAKLNVVYGRRLYRMKEDGDRLRLETEMGTLSTLLTTDKYNEFNSLIEAPWSPLNPSREPLHDPTPKELFEALMYPVLARSLDLTDRLDVEQFSLPGDRAQLLIYAPLPAGLLVNDPRFVTQTGYVLYIVNLFEPENR